MKEAEKEETQPSVDGYDELKLSMMHLTLVYYMFVSTLATEAAKFGSKIFKKLSGNDSLRAMEADLSQQIGR